MQIPARGGDQGLSHPVHRLTLYFTPHSVLLTSLQSQAADQTVVQMMAA